MQVPSVKQSSNLLYKLGSYHAAATSQHSETAALSAPFAAINDKLRSAALARENAELELVGARVARRFAEFDVEHAIRTIASTAHQIDNNLQSGPVFDAAFPKRLTAELAPRGQGQVDSGRALVVRISTQPATGALKEQFADSLTTQLDTLEARVDAWSQALQKVGHARAVEMGLREEWVTAMHRNIGLIKAMFPRSTDRQELYFDAFRRTGSTDTGAEDPELAQLLAGEVVARTP